MSSAETPEARRERLRAQREAMFALEPLLPCAQEQLHRTESGRASSAEAVVSESKLSELANFVRSSRQLASQAAKHLYDAVMRAFTPLEVAGAGAPITGTGHKRVRHEFTFHGSIQVDLELRWSRSEMRIHLSVDPPGGIFLLAFEDPVSGVPVAVVALESIQTELQTTIPSAELGFVPTERPWRIRLGRE
jgi:hypothetical protein